VLPEDVVNGTESNLTGHSRIYPDFSLGFGAFYKRVYGGFAVHHLHQPYMTPGEDPNARLNRRYTAHVGAMIPVYEKRFRREVVKLSPNLLFMHQNTYQQFSYGLDVHYRSLLVGMWGRHDLNLSYGALIFTVGYAREQFRIRYSYDAKLSAPDLYIPNMGAHEISMAVVFINRDSSPRNRTIKCPII
jgi:type IX secretion system PorP/SprF family membrane protein